MANGNGQGFALPQRSRPNPWKVHLICSQGIKHVSHRNSVEAHAHICASLSLSNGHGNLVWFINSLALARSEPVPPRCGCIYQYLSDINGNCEAFCIPTISFPSLHSATHTDTFTDRETETDIDTETQRHKHNTRIWIEIPWIKHMKHS